MNSYLVWNTRCFILIFRFLQLNEAIHRCICVTLFPLTIESASCILSSLLCSVASSNTSYNKWSLGNMRKTVFTYSHTHTHTCLSQNKYVYSAMNGVKWKVVFPHCGWIADTCVCTKVIVFREIATVQFTDVTNKYAQKGCGEGERERERA